jgi:septal ring factor EnvC (AmiA/AmiB activator)
VFKKSIFWIISYIFVFLVGIAFTKCSDGQSKSSIQANINARANETTRRLEQSQAKIVLLNSELEKLKAYANTITKSVDVARSTNSSLGEQIDSSLKYLSGTTDELDQIDAIVHAVQKRSDVSYPAVTKSKP